VRVRSVTQRQTNYGREEKIYKHKKIQGSIDNRH
jgi:hypothetical protein